MTSRTLFLAMIFAAATSCDRAPEANFAKPEAYAVQLAFEPAAGGGLQRVTLPAQALVALRRADLGDVRLFDSRGRVVPVALFDDEASAVQNTANVPVYPVIGPASALGRAGLSIRIEGDNVARVVTVDSSASPFGGAAPAAALLDTRALHEPANAIALDVEVPAGKPVTLTLLTSVNLKDWQPLAQKVLFRPGDGQALLGGATVALPGVDLRDRYVGISWAGVTGVSLKGASVTTSSVAPLARTVVATSAVTLADAHKLRFDLPDLARLTAIRLTQAGPDGVIPIKLYGRDQAEDRWTLISATMLRPGDDTNVLDLPGPPMNHYRIAADRRTAGFSAPPRLELLFDPVELLVAPSGTPPYRLAVGQGAAPATYLTLAEIAPQGGRLELADLPRAKLIAPNGPPPIVALQAGAPDGAIDPRKLLLWAALLLGTLVLAFAAFQLLRFSSASPSDKQDNEI